MVVERIDVLNQSLKDLQETLHDIIPEEEKGEMQHPSSAENVGEKDADKTWFVLASELKLLWTIEIR
eukprot:9179532-Ditylum_brightwellii.AAC.1